MNPSHCFTQFKRNDVFVGNFNSFYELGQLSPNEYQKHLLTRLESHSSLSILSSIDHPLHVPNTIPQRSDRRHDFVLAAFPGQAFCCFFCTLRSVLEIGDVGYEVGKGLSLSPQIACGSFTSSIVLSKFTFCSANIFVIKCFIPESRSSLCPSCSFPSL